CPVLGERNTLPVFGDSGTIFDAPAFEEVDDTPDALFFFAGGDLRKGFFVREGAPDFAEILAAAFFFAGALAVAFFAGALAVAFFAGALAAAIFCAGAAFLTVFFLMGRAVGFFDVLPGAPVFRFAMICLERV